MGAQAPAGFFACSTCGKNYRWKQELAGKKAKCKCGAVINCPATIPGDPPQDDDALFDLAPAPEVSRPAARTVIVAPAAAMPVMPVAGAAAVSRRTISYHAEVAAVKRQMAVIHLQRQ